MSRIVLLLRQLLAVLIVFGLVAGTSAHAMPFGMVQDASMTTQAMQTPCDQMAVMPTLKGGAAEGGMPCKAITPDCVKQMVCVELPALPTDAARGYAPVTYAPVTYWSHTHALTGLSHEPDLLPPIAG